MVQLSVITVHMMLVIRQMLVKRQALHRLIIMSAPAALPRQLPLLVVVPLQKLCGNQPALSY